MSQSKAFPFNEGQLNAVSTLVKFLTAPYVQDPFFVLDGPAGTGKSTVQKEINRIYSESRGQLAFTATTNKAAKVVRSMLGEACTIYSLLGLRVQPNGEVKELSAASPNHIDLSMIDAVFVDEAGMISDKLFNLIRHAAVDHNIRFVFVADRYQLPPVGEKESVIWKLPQRVSLSKVERHDNQILTLVTAIRTAMDQTIMNITIKNDNDGKEGIWKVAKNEFKARIVEDAKQGVFADTSRVKIIAWRNVKTAEYNKLIRETLFGVGMRPYEIGERLIAAEPCMNNAGEVILGTDEECIVEGISEGRHPLAPEFECINLKCRGEDSQIVNLRLLHPRSMMVYANALENANHAAKSNGKLWKAFWEMKELFHNMKYAYAITAHRAQGSTYETVYVDYQDILLNRERREAFQCLYVACSRPTTRLILA